MVRDHRDLVIETLAASEAELLDQLAEVTFERNTYRELACAAIDKTHHQDREIERQWRQIAQLREDVRGRSGSAEVAA